VQAPYGPAWRLDALADEKLIWSAPHLDLTRGFTALLVLSYAGVSTSFAAALARGAPGIGDSVFEIQRAGSDASWRAVIWSAAGSNTNTATTTYPVPTDGTPMIHVARWRPGTGLRYQQFLPGGRLVADVSGAAVPDLQVGNGDLILGESSANQRNCGGTYHALQLWGRRLSDAELAARVRSPFAVILERPRIVALSQGGPVAEHGAISEGAAAGSSFEAQRATGSALADTARAGGAFTAARTALSSMTEGARAGATFITSARQAGSLTEAARAGVVFEAQVRGQVPGTITEGTRAGEVMSATARTGSVLQEGAAASSSFDASAAKPGSLVGTARSSDTWTATGTRTAGVAEGAATGALFEATVHAAATWSEGARPGDAWSAIQADLIRPFRVTIGAAPGPLATLARGVAPSATVSTQD
jgi:hypothetical protein